MPDTEQTYQVTYKLSGGTGNFPPTTGLLPGVKVWAPSSIPTRDGCKFYGWYDVDEEGNDSANGIFAYVYEPGKINNYFRMPERDVVLKAIWVDPVTGVLKPDLGDEENPDPGTNPNPPIPGDGSIVSLFPISGAEDVGYDASNPPVFKIEFDREIASAYDQEFVADVDLTMDGAFSIYRASDDKLIYKPSEYAKFAFKLNMAKTVLTVTPVNNDTLLEPNTRYYITMGECFVRFADGTGSPAIEKGEWGFKTLEEFTLPEAITAKVQFKVDDGKSKKIDTTWNDGWFLNPATEYNRDLAITAVTLSGAAYVEDEDELPSDVSIQNALLDFGFDSVVSKNYDKNYYSMLSKENNDYVGYTFALKTIKTSATSTVPLIAIIIKGTSGNEEWFSNFNGGDDQKDPIHAGFRLAANRLLDDLDKYLSDLNLNRTQVKFFVTGHSRGAAVANLVAAELTKSPTARGYRYGQANVYGYTFATPAVSQFATEKGYSNVFNIVSGEDFVTRLPLVNWGFKRYGINLMLPSKSYYGDGYKTIYNRMNAYYFALKGDMHDSFGGTKAVDNVVDAFFKRANTTFDYYHTTWPITTLSVSESVKWLTTYQYATDELCEAIVNDSWSEGIWDGANFGFDLASISFSRITWFFIRHHVVSDHVFSAHSQVTYFSWLKSCSTEELFGVQNEKSYSVYKRMSTACPVDVYVYDEAGTLVASVINDTIVEDTLAVYVEENVKTFDLPSDQNYTVKIVATGNGTVTHTVEERAVEATDSTVLRTVSFNDINIAEGDELTGAVNNVSYTPAPNCALTKNDTTQIYPDYDSYTPPVIDPVVPVIPDSNYSGSSGQTAKTYKIDFPIIPGGNITATPATAKCGTNVTLTATPEEGYELTSIIVTDSKGNELELTNKGDGKYTFTMPDSKATVNAVFQLIPVQGETPAPWINPFNDVAKDTWYYDAVEFVSVNGLMNGISSTLFTPDGNLTRAQLAQILYNKEGKPAVSGSSAFVDVDPDTWYSDAVTWAAANGIVGGYGDGRFGPNDNITREQLAVMLWRYAGSSAATDKELHFTDTDQASGYALEAIRWAAENGVLNGYGDGRLGPQGHATRAQVAQMLKNQLER